MIELDTMYRVMILYMLNLVEYPLTNTQITNFVLEKNIQIISRYKKRSPVFCRQI